MRAAVRLAGLALLLVACLIPHLLAKAVRGRSPWPPRFLAAAGRVAGARVHAEGAEPAPHTLLLANHVSWLDILVLSSATGCTFVSKDKLGHPLIQWLADQNDTIYVNRAARHAVGEQVNAIRTALQHHRPVALFPEGTTGAGDCLLPFRSTLLAAMAPAPRGSFVQPVAIDYGSLSVELAWHEESAWSYVRRVLGRAGTFPVTVHILDPLPDSTDRKRLARLARERIASALAASSSAISRL